MMMWKPVYSKVPVVPVEMRKVGTVLKFWKRPRCIAVVPFAFVDMETRLNSLQKTFILKFVFEDDDFYTVFLSYSVIFLIPSLSNASYLVIERFVFVFVNITSISEISKKY